MRRAATALLSLVLLAGGCSAVTSGYELRETLTIEFDNIVIGDMPGRVVFLVLTSNNVLVLTGSVENPRMLAGVSGVTNLTLEIPFLLDPETRYSVGAFVDRDGNFLPDGDLRQFSVPVDNGTARIVGPMGTSTLDMPGATPGPLPFLYHIRALDPHVVPDGSEPETFDLVVVDAEDTRPVGYYRSQRVLGPDFDITLPMIVTEGKRYIVEFYADHDLIPGYTATGPANDHSWHRELVAGPGGVEGTFEHIAVFEELTFIPQQ